MKIEEGGADKNIHY